MVQKKTPFSKDQLESITAKYPTPFHIYLEKEIRKNARRLTNAFSWVEGFKEYFAVKATPNPYIIKILKSEGFGADCSSLPELLLAEKVGITGKDIMFSSNDTSATEFQKAKELGAIINLDDISHFPYLKKHAGLPDTLCFRYNPGNKKRGNAIIGQPEEAKFGLTHEQLSEAYKTARDNGIQHFGLHTMLASNELNPHYFIETAEMLFNLVVDISKSLHVSFEFVNIGGGIGIPYKPDDEPVDIESISKGIQEKYDTIIRANNCHPLKFFLECGRMITGPYGYLVSKVRHIKKTYKNYAGLDASIADLMRPALYGSYHHITVSGKEDLPHNQVYDLTGSLCENND
ncbi:diaminopimelate decarboxylase, partial [Fibrobacterota bacterium]